MSTVTQTVTILEPPRPSSPALHLRLQPPKPGAEEKFVALATRVETIARGTDLGGQVALLLKNRKPGESILVDTTALLMNIVEPASRQDAQFMESAVALKVLLEEELPSNLGMDTWITQFIMRQASLASKLRSSAAARKAQSDEYRGRYAAFEQTMAKRYNGLLDKALQCEDARVREEKEWQKKLEDAVSEANELLIEWDNLQPTVAMLNEERLQGQQELLELARKAERLL